LEKIYIHSAFEENKMKYRFENVLGSFIIDENKGIVGKGTKGKVVSAGKIKDTLKFFKDKQYFREFYSRNLSLTKKQVKKSVTEDNLIMQTISSLQELDKTLNLFGRRLSEWYALTCPEVVNKVDDYERLVDFVLSKSCSGACKELKVKEEMGADLPERDLTQMKSLAASMREMFLLREKHENYLEEVMKTYCPNLLELAGVTIGARLLDIGKGLKRLAMLPASTIQLLGAEKALFRHLRGGGRSPKYGILFAHQLVQGAQRKEKGKVARVLADKLSLCSRLDYFKGEFKAKEYRKELEARFG
jgi:nucleolar protein 56